MQNRNLRMLSLLLIFTLVINMILSNGDTAYAASTPVIVQSAVAGLTRDVYLGYGTSLYVEEGTSTGKTAIYYMNGSQKVYMNKSGAAGDDLSIDQVSGGAPTGHTISDDVTITMTGGSISKITATYNNNSTGTTTVIITGGTVNGSIALRNNQAATVGNAYLYSEINVTQNSAPFGNYMIKKDKAWNMDGAPCVPASVIMTIGADETLIIPEGSTLTNYGTIINNGGTVTINGTLKNQGTIKCNTHSYDNDCDPDCNLCGAVRTVSHQWQNATCEAPKTCQKCKTTEGSKLEHNYIYTAVNNVITETCTNGCTHKETATLKVDASQDLTYTGSAIQPLLVDYSSGWLGDKDLVISYEDDCVSIGSHTGSITTESVTATQTFDITKQKMTGILAVAYCEFYDGMPHSIQVTGVPEDATVTYSESKDGLYTTTNPSFTERGTYTVYYKIEKENYETITGNTTVQILKTGNSWTTSPSLDGWTYGEEANVPIAEAKFGTVIVEYKPADANYTAYTTSVPTQAGTYTVRFKAEGTDNYNSLVKILDLKIEKAELTVTATNDSKIYGETDPNLSWTITEGALTGTDKLEHISVTRTVGEDVNTYTMTVSQAEGSNPNYHITFETGTFTIYKRTIGIHWGNTSFTYDGTEKLPTAAAIDTVSGDEIGLTVTGSQETAGTDYTATVTGITGDKAENYQLPADVTQNFSIAKADQAAPDNLSCTNETIDGKSDGRITGVTTAMEYCKDGETDYTGVTDTEITGLPDGTYYIRYKADDNHHASGDTALVISQGRKLTVTLPDTQTGYTVTVDKTELSWQEDVTLTFSLAEGYSKCDPFAIRVNGTSVTLDSKGQYTIADPEENITVAVEGVADVTAPTAEITLGTNRWNQFFHTITFGLFFQDTQTVTIAAEDKGSGVDKIYYYLSAVELTEEQVIALADSHWTEYNSAFNIHPEKEYIIYAKAVDKDHNTIYINSEGLVLDSIAPTITGIANGETHYGDTTFTVTDSHMDVVTIDGKEVTLTEEGSYTITADGKEHTIAAADKSGNSSGEITITVIAISSLDDQIEDLTTDNVTSSHKTAIEEVQSFVKSLQSSGKTFTQAEQGQLEAMEENAEALLKKISDVTTEMADLTTKVNAYDQNKVKSDDKSNLNELSTRINTLLNGQNLTDDEITAMSDLKAAALELIEKIEDTAKAVADLTSDVNGYDMNTVKSNDQETINDLISDMTDLLNGNNLNDTEKEGLDEVRARAKELLRKIEDADHSSKTENTDKVKDVTSDTVITEDKKDLENAKSDLEKSLEDYKDNLTEEEIEAIQEEVARIEKALDVIEKVEQTEELINKLPDNITKADSDAIQAAQKAYNALSKYEQSLLDKDAKNKLEDAGKTLDKLNKADTSSTSPATGDTSHIWLWFALLLISGGGLFGTTIYKRKKEQR